MKKRAHIKISGVVQGVFYRASTKETADKNNVTGLVKNLPNGSVEAILEGDEQDIKAVILWCQKGPQGARVDHVEVNWADIEFTETADKFIITR